MLCQAGFAFYGSAEFFVVKNFLVSTFISLQTILQSLEHFLIAFALFKNAMNISHFDMFHMAPKAVNKNWQALTCLETK